MALESYFDKDWHIILNTYGYLIDSFILCICILSMLWFLRRRKLNLPPGPVGLPLVGYLPFLGEEPFKTLNDLSKKYGNVFSLYLGRKYVVILGDCLAAKEALNKQITLDRPPGIFDFQPDGLGVSSSNGEQWVTQRRFLVRTMKDLGVGRTAWENHVDDEVTDFVKMIANKNGDPIDVGNVLTSSVSNNITSFIFGKRLPPGPRRNKLNSSLDAMIIFFIQTGVYNYFPWLCNILIKLKIGSYYKLFSAMSSLNAFVRGELGIRKEIQEGTTDFIGSFKEAMENEEGKQKNAVFNEKNLIGNCQTLLSAGSETVRTALLWLFLAMTAYPDAQKKVHLELDTVLDKHKALWEDRFKLPYTYAAIMEAQRWKTLVPLNLARTASKDMKICGYDVPKGSDIISNAWAIHNDPRYWEEPSKFIPERFLQNGGKEVNLKAESYAPFSYGRRRCPGEIVGMMEIYLYFASIMQQFEIRIPNSEKPNLDAILGLTYMPVNQELCFIPR